ncbi:MAG: phosphate ABC transporter substrate-binding protein [Pontiellaceae bacterium]|nr:phosphate ABC transporter substrate-binding protein [Pontiellaceae bacterium]MBN2783593.1 phosphate ABC transporter substrate-binding protein [Pontiellaceae bacterium]
MKLLIHRKKQDPVDKDSRNPPVVLSKTGTRRVLCGVLLSLVPLTLYPGISAAETPENTPGKQRILIAGSSTINPLIREIADRYCQTHPDVEIMVESIGSGKGAKNALNGQIDIGMVARPLKENETDLFSIPIARDGTAFVINSANPVRSITKEQATDIFKGKLTNWKQLGGKDQTISLLTRARHQGVTSVVLEYLGIDDAAINLPNEALLNEDIVDKLCTQQAAFSILSIGALSEAIEAKRNITALSIDEIKPDIDSIRDGSWPMTRSLMLVTRSVPTGHIREFIKLTLSKEMHSVIKAHGFIPY